MMTGPEVVDLLERALEAARRHCQAQWAANYSGTPGWETPPDDYEFYQQDSNGRFILLDALVELSRAKREVGDGGD